MYKRVLLSVLEKINNSLTTCGVAKMGKFLNIIMRLMYDRVNGEDRKVTSHTANGNIQLKHYHVTQNRAGEHVLEN